MRQRSKRRTRLICVMALMAFSSLAAVVALDFPKRGGVSSDVRFRTPRATVEALLESYGVLDIPVEELRRRMELGRRFHLNDPDTMKQCFADLDQPSGEGLAGYVFGNLVRTQDDLSISITEGVAHAQANDPERRIRPVVLRKSSPGWQIVLAESVPRHVVRELRASESARASRASSRPHAPTLPSIPTL